MLTHELAQRLRELEEAIDTDSAFVRLVVNISRLLEPSINHMDALFSTPDPAAAMQYVEGIRAGVSSTIQEIKKYSYSEVFVQIAELKSRIDSIHRKIGGSHADGLVALRNVVTGFENKLDKVTKGYGAAQTIDLMADAKAVSEALYSVRSLVALLSYKLEGDTEESSDRKELTLLFATSSESKDVINKLTVLGDMYNELCPFFGVSAAAYPLLVVRAETGSLWLKLIGESRVITLLISLIESAVGYLHRTYTQEGKIKSIPRQLETAESILNFTKKLEEAGVDTAEIKENVQKSVTILSSRLNDLLVGEPTVNVNGESFSVGDALEQRFLREGKRLLLEDGHQNEETNEAAGEPSEGGTPKAKAEGTKAGKMGGKNQQQEIDLE